jgi:prepilin-type N-terminal cleavage/methylation domain-containing protein
MNLKRKNGMTLVEILVATLVFTLALSALLGGMSAIVDLIDLAKDMTVATDHLRNMLERIRSTPFASMLTRFPNNTTNGPGANPYANITGGYTLVSENITVTYANPAADPLEAKTTVRWLDKKRHSRSAAMSTFKTR